MKSLGTRLLETAAFDKPYGYRWRRPLGKFLAETAGGGYSHTKALFSTSDGRKGEILFASLDNEVSARFDVDGDIGATGGGDAFRIFATVLAAIKEMVLLDDDGAVEIISFAVFAFFDETPSSRSRLYERMARKFLPKGWSMERKKVGSQDDFVLTRSV